MNTPSNYDARYLEGIRLFNAGEFFDAHEVWEELWHESLGPERRFIQGLIHATVCAYHAYRGNLRGAARLFASGQKYMLQYPDPFWGLEVAKFWQEMATFLGDTFTTGNIPTGPQPMIVLLAESL